MKRSLLFLLAMAVVVLLPGCMTLFQVVPGPLPNSAYVLGGRTPFPMGRVSFCDDGGCGELFTYEDTGGLRIQSISTDSSGGGVWALAGSPLIYQGNLYYCSVKGNCSLRERFKTFEDLERIQIQVPETAEAGLAVVSDGGTSRTGTTRAPRTEVDSNGVDPVPQSVSGVITKKGGHAILDFDLELPKSSSSIEAYVRVPGTKKYLMANVRRGDQPGHFRCRLTLVKAPEEGKAEFYVYSFQGGRLLQSIGSPRVPVEMDISVKP